MILIMVNVRIPSNPLTWKVVERSPSLSEEKNLTNQWFLFGPEEINVGKHTGFSCFSIQLKVIALKGQTMQDNHRQSPIEFHRNVVGRICPSPLDRMLWLQAPWQQTASGFRFARSISAYWMFISTIAMRLFVNWVLLIYFPMVPTASNRHRQLIRDCLSISFGSHAFCVGDWRLEFSKHLSQLQHFLSFPAGC
jgi:hypothetical protein